jgi:putative DNA primase/helicase
VLRGDADLIAFLRRAVGYSLTGHTVEHAIFFPFGPGGNGKGVFLDTVRDMLGAYGDTAAIATFLESKHEQHPTDVAKLVGRRFVLANEVPTGRYWDESKVKNLTGGEKVSARLMRQDFFEFQPEFKLWVVGNNKPSFRSVDDAMRRRMNLIPFTVKISDTEKDVHLRAKLAAEASGILRWAIEGCLEWQRTGLAAPASVKDGTKAYLDGEDRIASWIEDCCDLNADYRTNRIALFDLWRGWCIAANDRDIGTRNAFYEELRKHGLCEAVVKGVRCFAGIAGKQKPLEG